MDKLNQQSATLPHLAMNRTSLPGYPPGHPDNGRGETFLNTVNLIHPDKPAYYLPRGRIPCCIVKFGFQKCQGGAVLREH